MSARLLVGFVSLIGLACGAMVVMSDVASQPSHCCGSSKPYTAIFRPPLSRVEVVLAKGDGQAFAAIAEDPLMRRPDVFPSEADAAYRDQRPVWGYLAWLGSGGQASRVGLVLGMLTVFSCGIACGVAALLLLERGLRPWWSLLVLVAGFQTLTELTPELLAVSLVGIGLLLWERDRHRTAIAVFSVAVLTRETMLFAIAALALWELYQHRNRIRVGLRRAALLTIPVGAYLVWIALVGVRVGAWPFQASQGRFAPPPQGLLYALDRGDALQILMWVVVGLVVALGAAKLAPRDVLTWIAVTYLGLASLLGGPAWIVNAGFQRTLLPLYVFGGIAFASGVRAHRATFADPRSNTPEPSTQPALR